MGGKEYGLNFDCRQGLSDGTLGMGPLVTNWVGGKEYGLTLDCRQWLSDGTKYAIRKLGSFRGMYCYFGD